MSPREKHDDDESSDAIVPKRRSARLSSPADLRRTGVDTPLVELKDAGEAREFLLAERPLLVRGTLWLSAALVAALIAWASMSRIDIVISAPGYVRPRGDVRPAHSPVTGIVTDVLVREGMLVQKDQVLIRFDKQPLRIELDQVMNRFDAKEQEKRMAAEIESRRAQSYVAELAKGETDVELARVEVDAEKKRHELALEAAKLRLATAQATLAVARTTCDGLTKKLERDRERERAGAMRGTELEETQRQLDNARAELARAERSVEEAKQGCILDESPIALAAKRLELRQKAQEELKTADPIKRAEAQARIQALEAELTSLKSDREGAQLRYDRAEVRAPEAGLITRLAVTHAGAHVAEGATVAEISPTGRDLVLEAYVKNSDRGDLRDGQAAKLRFATFNYQEYGAVDGIVSEISRDAVKAATDEPGTVPATTEPVYKVTITIQKDTLESTTGKKGRIELGMAAQADIVVDEQALIFLAVRELKQLFDTKSAR